MLQRARPAAGLRNVVRKMCVVIMCKYGAYLPCHEDVGTYSNACTYKQVGDVHGDVCAYGGTGVQYMTYARSGTNGGAVEDCGRVLNGTYGGVGVCNHVCGYGGMYAASTRWAGGGRNVSTAAVDMGRYLRQRDVTRSLRASGTYCVIGGTVSTPWHCRADEDVLRRWRTYCLHGNVCA